MPPDSAGEVVLAHDYLLVMRGAERTFAEIAACWPGAPIATLLHDPAATGAAFAGHEVRTSPLQRLPIRQRGFRALLPLLPAAAERLPVGDAAVVVSSSSAFAKGVRPPSGAVHVDYCHSPFRYAWHERERALAEAPRALRPALSAVLRRVRAWDLRANARVDRFVANAEITRERIARFYERDAVVVHPPVAVERFGPGTPEDFFLVVGEVTAHKRTAVALEACRRAGAPVVVVGEGPELARLRVRYPEARFRGRIGDEDLARLYARCRALVVAAPEEFGIAAVEAQASGRPVVACDVGGARETVLPGQTGVLVPLDDAGALAEALRHTDFDRFDPRRAVESARRFSRERFRERITAEVDRATKERA